MTQIVQNITNKLVSPDFVAEHRQSEKDFTRNRSLTFPHLISFMLNMVNSSLKSELRRFFQVIDNSPLSTNTVSDAAFCKARKKVSHTAFKALNTCLVDTFYQSHSVKKWHGHRLLAVDGSVTSLHNIPVLHDYFGKAKPHSNRPAVRLSQLYDVLNKLSIDVQIDSHSTGERAQAIRHLTCVQPNDLIIYDRGYPAQWFFRLHQIKRIHYCARVTLGAANVYDEFLASGKKEAQVLLPCSDKSTRYCKKLNLSTASLKARLIRIDLPSGETELLVTSLRDKKSYPYKCFKKLYHQRWGIEEDYKLMKSRLTIENFSGLSVEAVLQDIHAKVVTKNIAAVAIVEADKVVHKTCKKRQLKYKINFTYTLSQLKDNIVRFLLHLASADLSTLFIKTISSAVNAYRPDRHFIRKDKRKLGWNRPKYNVAYKRIG